MKNKILSSTALLGVTVLFLTSCAKVPQTEIDAAMAAVDQAKTAGADVYAHESYIALQDSLKGIIATIESQKSKLIKNYTTAKEHLAGVTEFAGMVTQQAENRKEEMKIEIQNTIAEVKALIGSSRQLILEAPKGKEGTSALVAIKGEIDAVEATINETSSTFEKGDYFSTLDKARAAKGKAASVNNELTEVITKYKANVKNRKS